MTPIRVQRSRKGGTKLPPRTMCCTRQSKGINPYANPYRIETHPVGYWKLHITDPTPAQEKIYLSAPRGYTSIQDATADAVRCFRQWLEIMTEEELAAYLAPLREWEHLACWCKLDATCHVDVLLEKLSAE